MSDFSKARQSRRRFLLNASLLGVAAGVGATGLTACGGGAGTRDGNNAGGRSGKPGETLFIGGLQWEQPTHFNPFGTVPTWPTGQNTMQLVYESLLRFNLVTGELQPGLATELQEPDPHTFVLPIQPKAKWSDGKPVTADDVVYSLTMSQRHDELDKTLWEYVESIDATDEKTVELKLKKQPYNPGIVRQTLASAWVLPKHIWSEYEKEDKPIAEHQNLDPVGSGPYKVDDYNQQHVSYVRDDNYWGKDVFGLPAPKYIDHPIFKDNAAANLAFTRGELDVSQTFLPRIWETWEKDKKPVGTWFKEPPYHIPASTPMLVINCQEKGLDDPRVRRALAHFINYANIADKAMSRYSEPATASMLLPIGSDEKYYDQANVDKHGWKYDVAEGQRILEEEVGAKKGKDGIYVLPDGTRLGPWKIRTPNGWSDWQDACRIIADNAKDAGIDISTEFPDQAQVTEAVNNGNFHFAVWYIAGISPATPWQRFRDVLDDRGVPPKGQQAFYNYGRFKHPDVPELLDKLAAASSDDEIKQISTQLDTIFMENAPMIPVMYRPDQFFEFYESNWTNFPTSENPYAPPQFRGPGVEWLSKLKKV